MRWMVFAAALAAAGCARASQPFDLQQSADRNVLLVTVDTLRADALGCDGGPARTPAIDALAAEGLRFRFAHAHAVLTLPSHASILTGRYPFQHGVRDNSGYRLASADTLASRLKSTGFATGAFVGSYALDARFGLNAGFDVYDGRFDDRATGGALIVPERPATAVVARATAWISAQGGRWFAWVHVYDPHAPYAPPPPFDAEYAGRPYFGEVAAVDRALAPLFDAARRSPRPTLVVLTGDHGEALGDHGEMTHGLLAYESTLHVPLIVSEVGPRRADRPVADRASGSGGHVAGAPARHVDIVPTILDTLGLPVPAALPGHSLRTEADRRGGVDRPSYFEATTALLDYGGAPLDGLIVGRDKLIEAPIPELYDLEHDPGETVNTAASAGDRRRALQARLASLAPSGPAAPRAESPEAAARLRALGYTSPGVPGHRTFRDEDDAKQFVAIDRLLHEAVALGESGRFDDAIERYRSILRARPTLVAASRHLAFAYWRAGAAGPAIDTLRAALAASPGNAGIEVQLGTYLIDADRTAEAIALLTAAAAAEPDVDTLNALGLAYGRANRGREALAVFDRALALDPESGTVLANVGAVQLDLGRIDLARGAFTRAVRSEPDLPGAHAGLALVAIRTGDSRTAVDEWTRVVSLDPSNLDALYDLGIQLARDRRMAEARPYLERFARIAPPAQYAKERRTVETILGSR